MWVNLVGRTGPKLYVARMLLCYKGWPIKKILQLNKESCEVALTMSTNRQARAGLDVTPDVHRGGNTPSGTARGEAMTAQPGVVGTYVGHRILG